jgi:hypothetical protein
MASFSDPPPIGSLLRNGTRVATVMFADLGGDGIEDIILHAESETQADFRPPQNFVDALTAGESAAAGSAAMSSTSLASVVATSGLLEATAVLAACTDSTAVLPPFPRLRAR